MLSGSDSWRVLVYEVNAVLILRADVPPQGLPDGSLQLFAETGCSKTPVPSKDVAGLYVGVHEDPFKLIEVRRSLQIVCACGEFRVIFDAVSANDGKALPFIFASQTRRGLQSRRCRRRSAALMSVILARLSWW